MLRCRRKSRNQKGKLLLLKERQLNLKRRMKNLKITTSEYKRS